MDYNELRHFADSWGLVYLFAVFSFAVAWAWRPGARTRHGEAERIPFNED